MITDGPVMHTHAYVCPSALALMQARNLARGSATAGVTEPLWRACKFTDAPIPITIVKDDGGYVETSEGWVVRTDLTIPKEKKVYKPVRPQLYDATGTKCVYSDVSPHDPVK